MAKKNKSSSNLKFYQKLVLNRYLLKQFGAEDFKDLASSLKNPKLEEIDEEGVTGFYHELIKIFSDKTSISITKLSEYDLNIVSHLRKINDNRNEKLNLKYFQYLTLLFTEYYLDCYFNDKDVLLTALNNYITDFNNEFPDQKIKEYNKSNLNKIAIWNATGSGKTILMHINYYQYLHYAKNLLAKENSSIILLTPKAGLSLQHLIDFQDAGIPAKIFDKSESKFLSNQKAINIIEITKLGEKDGDTSVAVSRFGSENIVFVDEGHRGASGDIWYKYRNEICKDGFSFEYSATFGQAVKSSKNKSLEQEYAKCILFDYSYKYFYSDGYGKDYNIINLEDDSNEHLRSLYLTACLLTFYQQKKLYLENHRDLKGFNLENPLFVFVGASVNAVRSVKKQKVSDVVDILNFFKDFVTNNDAFIAHLQRIITGQAGLLDSKNRDIFRNTFSFVATQNLSANDLYLDILKNVFHCQNIGATLHVENLKGIQGEISIRVGDNDPFGLINVGDDSALISLCNDNGFETSSIDYTESLFNNITKSNSTINLLIGSKKFTEGWNCWRVSTMGLMNVGRSEGSEIIQLFGRGVRLKGHSMSLKRSNFLVKDCPSITPPKNIGILETLNIFGVRADYMNTFKEMLEEEGVPTDKEQPFIINLPIIRNKKYKTSKLLTLQIRDGLNFKKNAPKPILGEQNKIDNIILDCYAKVQFETSKRGIVGAITKQENYLSENNLVLLDYDKLYFELQRYKNEKSRYNFNISKQSIIKIISRNDWYKLLIPSDELIVRSISDYERFFKIALTLLIKYFDKDYYTSKQKWEKPLLTLSLMNETDENFLKDDEYMVTITNPTENEEMIEWLQNLASEVETAKRDNAIIDFVNPKNDITAIAFAPSLYNPVLYLAKNNKEIVISPVALNESENKFIQDLKKYTTEKISFFSDKEFYIIRNKSKTGIGFFEDKGFYPDFIMWLIVGDKQYITFIDPHGMRNTSIMDSKVEMYSKIKEIGVSLTNDDVILNSIILSPTKHSELIEKHITVDEWLDKNVLFMDDISYIEKIFKKFV